MSDRRSPQPDRDGVYRFWQEAAKAERDAQGLRPSARDPWLQDCVEWTMESLLPRGTTLLDVGCGDGASTLRFARSVGHAHGIDFVEQYVERARSAAATAGVGNATFSVCDVTDLEPVRAAHPPFQAAVSIRCLINLATADQQASAIAEIAGTLEPGALYLASEGWSEGLSGLNLRRTRAGLAPIEVAPYNLLLSRTFFEQAAARWFDIVGYHGLGTYLYISRVVQPLLVQPAEPRHDHPLNQVAARLHRASLGHVADFQDCDYAGVYVLRRRHT